MLSWTEDATLGPTESVPILALTMEATPAAECFECVVTLEDGADGVGQPVATVVTASGRSYRPVVVEARTEVCGN